MSRIGRKPIAIPADVNIDVQDDDITVKGKLGSQKITVTGRFEFKIENNALEILNKADDHDKKNKALHGLYRSLIGNMVVGVSQGFEKDLEIVGVGYRANQQNTDVVFQLGYSHNIVFTPPAGITVEVIEPTKLKVKGIDKQQVGQVAANIRELRSPEPYKGKGIRYKGEYIRKKAGKAGKK